MSLEKIKAIVGIEDDEKLDEFVFWFKREHELEDDEILPMLRLLQKNGKLEDTIEEFNELMKEVEEFENAEDNVLDLKKDSESSKVLPFPKKSNLDEKELREYYGDEDYEEYEDTEADFNEHKEKLREIGGKIGENVKQFFDVPLSAKEKAEYRAFEMCLKIIAPSLKKTQIAVENETPIYDYKLKNAGFFMKCLYWFCLGATSFTWKYAIIVYALVILPRLFGHLLLVSDITLLCLFIRGIKLDKNRPAELWQKVQDDAERKLRLARGESGVVIDAPVSVEDLHWRDRDYDKSAQEIIDMTEALMMENPDIIRDIQDVKQEGKFLYIYLEANRKDFERHFPASFLSLEYNRIVTIKFDLMEKKNKGETVLLKFHNYMVPAYSKEELRQKKREQVISDVGMNEPVVTQVLDLEKENVNPYADRWATFFRSHFSQQIKDRLLIPRYEDLGATEIHVMPYDNISYNEYESKKLLIEAAIKKTIYAIHRNYKGDIGTTAIEFAKKNTLDSYGFDECPISPKPSVLTLGKSIKGAVYWDLEKEPHGMIIGTTGAGKSVALNNLILQAVNKKMLLYFVDFKDGIEFGIFEKKGYRVIDTRENFLKFVEQLHNEMVWRNRTLKRAERKSLSSYNEWARENGLEEIPRIIVFIDEYADVTAKKDEIAKEATEYVDRLLAKARASGIHILFGTQRPDADIFGGGKARNNIAMRLCGKMKDARSSQLAINSDDAYSKIPDHNFGGYFIKSTEDGNVLIRTPFEEDVKFSQRIDQWSNNPFENYRLHTSEQVEDESSKVIPISTRSALNLVKEPVSGETKRFTNTIGNPKVEDEDDYWKNV